MIGEVLLFLRKHLDRHLRVAAGGAADGVPADDKVVFFVETDPPPSYYKLNLVTLVLVNVEEERVLRSADPHIRINDSGVAERVQPDIRFILTVAFIARFSQYNLSWDTVSKIIAHFQTNRVFESETTPDLPAGVARLGLEMLAPGFVERSALWSAVKGGYQPGIIYRVSLLAFRDREPRAIPQVAEPSVTLKGVP